MGIHIRWWDWISNGSFESYLYVSKVARESILHHQTGHGFRFNNGNGMWSGEKGLAIEGEERLSRLNGYLSELTASGIRHIFKPLEESGILVCRTDEELLRALECELIGGLVDLSMRAVEDSDSHRVITENCGGGGGGLSYGRSHRRLQRFQSRKGVMVCIVFGVELLRPPKGVIGGWRRGIDSPEGVTPSTGNIIG
ncbi:unnamed protein product [Arabis nemorensis]|uniref:Uncharacterized protein n=1 Tax=Arabis nemorensis TaxID=586526 RepID=A0A565AS96_9BRAS|nr:unnamed protein product [Arabis nemorensis]